MREAGAAPGQRPGPAGSRGAGAPGSAGPALRIRGRGTGGFAPLRSLSRAAAWGWGADWGPDPADPSASSPSGGTTLPLSWPLRGDLCERAPSSALESGQAASLASQNQPFTNRRDGLHIAMHTMA
ncbi:hypothetical protein DV515_00000749, partial [Chloebia gouldiae]